MNKLLRTTVFIYFLIFIFGAFSFSFSDTVTGAGSSAYYYYDSGSASGTLDLNGGTTWTVTIQGLDGSALTGDKIFDFIIENIEGGSSTVLLPLRVYLDNAGPGAHLFQSDDNGYVVKSQQQLLFGMAPDTFDLRIVLNQRTDGRWNVMPYFRILPLGFWTPFNDGAWVSDNAFDLDHVRLVVALTSGTNGTLTFHAPNAVSGGTVFDSHFLNATAEGKLYVHYLIPGNPSSQPIGLTAKGFFTSTNNPYIPDAENYGIDASFSVNPQGGIPLVDVMDHGVVTSKANWAISYYSPEPANLWSSPWHSVLYGSPGPFMRTFHPDNDGTGGIPDIMYATGVMIYDGIYHSVNHGDIPTGSNTIYFTGMLYEVGMNYQGQNVWSTQWEQSYENAVLVAEEDIKVKYVTALYGDICTNDDISIRKGSPSTINGNLIALDKIKISKNNTIVGNVYAGHSYSISSSSTITGRAVEDTTMPPFIIPEPSFNCGTTDIDVPTGGTLNLPPGSYDYVHVRKNASITFSSGTYYIRELRLEKGSTFTADITNGAVKLNITKKLMVRDNVVFNITPSSPDYTRQLQIAVKGKNKIRFGRNCVFRGDLTAPRQVVSIKRDFKMKGAIRAYRISIGRHATIYHHSAPYTLPKVDRSDLATETLNMPIRFDLAQNYPNPFNPTTTIAYSLPTDCQVQLQVFDILGKEVATLVSEKVGAGHHQVVWNGRDKFNRPVSSGIYLYRLTATPIGGAQNAPFIQTRRMVFMK